MSVSAWLEFSLVTDKEAAISAMEVFNQLLHAGWTFNGNGLATVLPLGDVDDFNWYSAEASDEQILSLIDAKSAAGETVGVVMTWLNSGVGGQFQWENQRLSVSLSINRIRLQADEHLTDVNWYFEKIVPALNSGSTRVFSLKYDQQL